jgi:hypothetical protein
MVCDRKVQQGGGNDRLGIEPLPSTSNPGCLSVYRKRWGLGILSLYFFNPSKRGLTLTDFVISTVANTINEICFLCNKCSKFFGVFFSFQERTFSYSEEALDTGSPMDILEEEELERISGLLQRDNLVRGLGIVEHVYRLLHCTPGTVGIVKPESKPQTLPLVSACFIALR